MLFGAFIVFITIRGDLPKWLGLLGLGGSPTGTAASGASAQTNSVGGLPSTPALPSLGQSNALISTPTNGVPSLATDNLTPVNTGYTGPVIQDLGTWDN